MEEIEKSLRIFISKSRKLNAVFETELPVILIDSAEIGASDQNFSSSILGKNFAENAWALSESSYVPRLLTSAVFIFVSKGRH